MGMAEVEKKYCYEFRRPAVTVDVVCLRAAPGGLEVLLVRRARDPYQGAWAVPGGFVNPDEDLESAARRELAEETSLVVDAVEQFRTFGRPDRDPRGRVISVAFLAWAKDPSAADAVKPADDADEARWFILSRLPALAFDHREILHWALIAARRFRKLGLLQGLDHVEF